MAKRTFDPWKEIDYICNWIKDYFIMNGPEAKAVIGISGGKDSTIAAALLARALGPERVIGVMMPEHVQSDIDDARKVCEYLGIRGIEIDIGPACDALYRSMDEGIDYDHKVQNTPAVSSNTPARMRMATLYAVAALVGGRVANTCNYSENYVGYTTKFGDGAGDFALLHSYTVREVIAIGDALELPMMLVHKTPSDGLSGKTDEDNMGFTYETLDDLILDNIKPDYETYREIQKRHDRNIHKTSCYRPPCPWPLTRRWDDEEEWF